MIYDPRRRLLFLVPKFFYNLKKEFTTKPEKSKQLKKQKIFDFFDLAVCPSARRVWRLRRAERLWDFIPELLRPLVF
jgi:hypothetical protein